MSSSKSSIRLEIDGSLSHVLESAMSSCPHVEIPPFLSSISSIHTGEESHEPKKKKHKQHTMTLKRYNYLCGNIVFILMVEISILLSVLVTSDCSFYSVQSNESLFLSFGIFRYSFSNESSSQRRQCLFYGSTSLQYGAAVGEYLQPAQGFAVAAPCLAAAICISLVTSVLRRTAFCGRWTTTILLLVSALFQLLVVVCFDEDLVW